MTTNQESIHDRIDRERKTAQPRAIEVRKFREYALGRQRGTLTREQQALLRGLTGNLFCDNVCKMVLLAATGRVQLIGFKVAEPQPAPDPLAPPPHPDAAPRGPVTAWLWDWWVTAQLPRLQTQVHWATLRDGNHAVACSWDNDKGAVRLTRERWWDGKAGIWLSYDEQDQPVYAVKEWKDADNRFRRVLWWPDRIERYILDGNGWRPNPLDPTDATTWHDAWLDRDGRPLGLPVVHFANAYVPADTDDVDSIYGQSELDGGVLGLQDEVNDVHRDLTSSARLTGFQMYWATGYRVERNLDGSIKEPLYVAPGQVWYNEDAQGKFGTLTAGDMSQLEQALLTKLQAVSRNTSTPLHLITGGDWPSGEALARADKPLSSKAAAICRAVGPPWASLAHKATLLSNTFGTTHLDTTRRITAIFAPTDDPELSTAPQPQTSQPTPGAPPAQPNGQPDPGAQAAVPVVVGMNGPGRNGTGAQNGA